ncbi:IclR family transcriptional regulator [Streptomyces sp. KL116D]|uniref:IclR family transcriptional regulator n=1 Tax=Streptomyces sp. KL116D TaxID=3045152 RepID=UPI003557ECBB
MSAIQLLKKAGQIVDELARLGPSTPAELAKAVSEPRPSVYRIAAALEQTQLVRPAGDGRLELGTGVLRLGEAVVDAYVDRVELRKQLRWAQGQLGMSVSFRVLQGGGALCLDQVDGSDVDMLVLAPGRTLPLHAGAASQALLAFLPAKVRDQVLVQEPFEPLTPQTPVKADDLQLRLERTVARGWSIEDGEAIEGVASIGAPVRDRSGDVVGAVCVAGLRERVLAQEGAASETVLAAARAIEASIAGRSRPDKGVGDSVPGVPVGDEPAGSRSPAVIAKAGALMEVLADEHVATSTRLTERLEEPVSSVYRMLGTLAEAGWVEQIGPRGAYRVGGKMLRLSGEMARRLDVRRAAVPVLEEIHKATGETTFLTIRRGTRAVCIERVDGVRVNSRVLQLGQSLPLHVGAAPRALLAFEERTAWEEYAAIATNSGDPWRDLQSRPELYADLERIRVQGHVVSDNNVTPGIAAIGAPIFDHRGEVAASLSVSGLRDGILATPGDGLSVTDLVRNGAAELSRYLGAPTVLPAGRDDASSIDIE